METKEAFAVMSLSDLRAIMRECIAEARARKEPRQDELLTSKEVQLIFDITPVTLWKWNKRGYLNPVKIGGKKLYYNRADIEKLQEGRV